MTERPALMDCCGAHKKFSENCSDCRYVRRLERVRTTALAWRDARSLLYDVPRPEGAEKAYHLAVDALYRALEP
jgi:hypothetical protein